MCCVSCRVIETRAKVWENEKCCENLSHEDEDAGMEKRENRLIDDNF